MVSEISFSSTQDVKIAPIIAGGAIFAGKAIVGGAISAAASWGGATRFINNRFPTFYIKQKSTGDSIMEITSISRLSKSTHLHSSFSKNTRNLFL